MAKIIDKFTIGHNSDPDDINRGLEARGLTANDVVGMCPCEAGIIVFVMIPKTEPEQEPSKNTEMEDTVTKFVMYLTAFDYAICSVQGKKPIRVSDSKKIIKAFLEFINGRRNG